jgi:hypothetical protein
MSNQPLDLVVDLLQLSAPGQTLRRPIALRPIPTRW